MPDRIIDRIYVCSQKASRVNAKSLHRKELRRILDDHDLKVAEALLFIDGLTKLHPEFGPMHIDGLVRDAKRMMAWTQ